MHTGDIILCSGNGFLSRKIKWANRIVGIKGPAAEITHVAMATNLTIRGVFESTYYNKWAKRRGVQENPYRLWLRNYPGAVWRRRINIDIPTFTAGRFINDHLGDDYESGIPGLLELLACVMRINVRANLANIHCSELITAFYQHLHLFPDMLLANNFPPYTFWPGGDFEKNLINCSLGEPILLKGV